MKTILRTSSLATILAGLLGSIAYADAPGVVVLGFDGDGSVASSTRGAVLELVARDYGVVAPRRWRDALDDNAEVRPEIAWANAARQVGAVAVIEGKTTRTRNGRRLQLVVRDARNGKTLEEIEARLEPDGLSGKAKAQLEIELTDALFFSDDAAAADEAPARGARRAGARRGAREDDSSEDPAGRDRARDDDARDDDARDDDARDGDARARDAGYPPRIASDTKVDVAASHAEPVRLALFEAPKDDGSGTPGVAVEAAALPPPIAELSLLGSASSRQFGFTGAVLPADYPGATVTTLGLAAAVFPMSRPDARGRRNGLGASVALATSVASDVAVQIDDEIFDFPVTQRSWQLAAHYRYPAGPALVDGHVGYASLSHYIEDIPEDADEELDLLDAEYSYLDLGGRVEVEAGPRTTLGFSASYLYVTQLGLLTDPDMLGGAESWGMQLGLDLKVQLGHRVFAAAGADYRRINLAFNGDGAMYDELGIDVDDATDTFVGGHLQVGVGF